MFVHRLTEFGRRAIKLLMSEQRIVSCEMKWRGEWRVISLEQASVFDPRRLRRCVECHGPIRLTTVNNTITLVHTVGHDGCSRHTSYSGVRSKHPRALS